MKKFLLSAFILLPALALAQPSLTFTPSNGATNVSTTDDLLIVSDEALNLLDGTDLSDSNVDA